MRYMKNDPYLKHPSTPRGSCDNTQKNKTNHDTTYSSSSSQSQNNRLLTFLRKSDWSSAYNRIQSHPQEAHHSNVDLNGNTALHLAFLCGSSSSSNYSTPPVHLIEAIVEADSECAASIVTSKKDDYFDPKKGTTASYKDPKKKKRGTTPLHLAVLHRTSPTTLSIVLSANPSAANTVDEVGRTPLHRACSSIGIGGGTGDLNVLLNYHQDETNGGGGGLLPIESFTCLVNATSFEFLLEHKDDRGYTALSYLSKRFEERAIWAVDHMRRSSTSAACANASAAAREDEEEESDDDYHYEIDNEVYEYKQRIRRRRRRRRRHNSSSSSSSRNSLASRYDTNSDEEEAPLSGYSSSCCHSLRSYGLGDFWDRTTAILLRAYSLLLQQNELSSHCIIKDTTAATTTTATTDVAQESVLHAALTLLSTSSTYCPMTVAYLAVSVAHPNEARLFDKHGRLPIHLAAGAIVDDDDDDDDDIDEENPYHHSHHHKTTRWKRWKDDTFTKRRKRKTHKHVRDVLSILIDLYPHGVRVTDGHGHLPFEYAEKSGRRWDDGLGLLLYEYPRCVVVHVEEEGGGGGGGDTKIEGKGDAAAVSRCDDEFQDVCYPYILSLVGRGIIMPSSPSSSYFENEKRCSSTTTCRTRGGGTDDVMMGGNSHRYVRRLGVMYEILRSQPHLMCFD